MIAKSYRKKGNMKKATKLLVKLEGQKCHKKLSKKDDIVKIIREKFSDKITVEGKGKKYYVKIKTEGDLFANA